MSDRIEHDPEALQHKMPMLGEAQERHLQIQENLVRDYGMIGDILDGQAYGELDDAIVKVYTGTRDMSLKSLSLLGIAIGSQEAGVGNAKAARDLAGENASTAGGWGEGTGGKH